MKAFVIDDWGELSANALTFFVRGKEKNCFMSYFCHVSKFLALFSARNSWEKGAEIFKTL